MDKSVYDGKIEDLTIKIDKTRQKMAPVLITFLNETEIYVTKFYKDTIKEYVVSHPDITKKYGKDGIRDLKYECRELIKLIPEIVEMHLGTDKFWSHKCPINDLKKECKVYPAFSTHYNVSDSNKRIIESLRHILGYLGDLLLKYGYIKTGKYSEWKMSEDEEFKYKGSIECTPEMKTSLKIYLEMDKELAGLINEVKDIEKQKKEAEGKDEAEEIWNTT
ncbi:hypothetical protein [Methanobacterium sp. SMA-27]|uniref:hypothetical protein n=1 Tax=Methanobacterium sp. SMA-27 TaxID=1495336 RepID=UPI00064F69A0|nr:hypothetical protein [Methanobacterium sp. SMA-27]